MRRETLLEVVLDAVSRERANVAEALHEGPQQVLTALQLYLGTVAEETAEINEIKELVEGLAQSFRAASAGLTAPPRQVPLEQALAALARDAQSHLGTSLTGSLGTASPSLRQHGAAIAEVVRALVIVSWQGTPQTISVSLHTLESEARLMVEIEYFLDTDDVLQATASTEAMRALGAQVVVEKAGEGANVLIRLPLSQESGQ